MDPARAYRDRRSPCHHAYRLGGVQGLKVHPGSNGNNREPLSPSEAPIRSWPVLGAVSAPRARRWHLPVIGSFGFALPFFTLGILVAGDFGLAEKGNTIPADLFEKFLYIPYLPRLLAGPYRIRSFLHVPSPGGGYLPGYVHRFLCRHPACRQPACLDSNRPFAAPDPGSAYSSLSSLLFQPFTCSSCQDWFLAGGYADRPPVMQQYMAILMAALPFANFMICPSDEE